MAIIADAKMMEAQKNTKPQTPIHMQIILGIIANMVIISPGMNLGFSAMALPAWTSKDNPLRLTQDEATWVASITSVAMPIGCLLSGPFIDRLGRKFAMYSINVFMIVGWGIMATADITGSVYNTYIQLLIGRFIAGIGCGLCSVPATVYMSEISTPNLRGVVCAWSSVAYAIGVQLIYILGYFFKDDWKLLARISGVIPIICMILIKCFITESPIWYQNNCRFQKAENSFKKLQGYGRIRQNLILAKESQEEKLLAKERKLIIITPTSVYNETCVPTTKFTQIEEKFEFITKPECYKPFILMITFFFFQQFSGIFVIIYYAVDIVKATGSTIDPYIAAICIGTVRVIVSMIVSYTSKKFGRRLQSIASGTGMTLCMILLSSFLFLIENESTLAGVLKSTFYWIPLAALMLYFFMSTFGFLTIPFMMIGEVYPAKHRGVMGGLTACCCYIFSFMIVKLYPFMLTNLGRSGLFLFYSIVSLIGTLFVVMFLPETKGKTLQQIQEYFNPGLKEEVVEKQDLIVVVSDEKYKNKTEEVDSTVEKTEFR